MVWYAWLRSEYMLYYWSLRQSIIMFGFNQSQTGSIGISFLQSQDVTGLDLAKYQGPVFQRSNPRWTWYLKQSQKPGISKNPRDLVFRAMWNWQLTISVFKPRQAKQYLYRLPPFSFQNDSIISGSQDMILKLAVACLTQIISLYKAKCKDNDINGWFVSKTGLIDGTHVQESI